MNKKILIVGDSFATYHRDSWTCHLGDDVLVDNLASNGSSEYRILKTIEQVDATEYDCIIVVHTSPNRIYIEKNPYYQQSATHSKCDLIYEDICSRKPDEFAKNVSWWYENVFDLAQAADIHRLIVEKIQLILKDQKTLHISFFDLESIHGVAVLHDIWKKHPGTVNHLDNIGNTMVANYIRNQL